jgi:glycosyltransferase involved in cell wall biosynthesis
MALTLRINVLIYKIIRQQRIDLLHANTTVACLQGILAARLASVPIIWHVRDSIRLSMLGTLLEAYADHIVTVSAAVRDQVLRKCLYKVSIIYNGILLSKPGLPHSGNGFSCANARRTKADLIMVAQYVPWKNHSILIDAVSRLKREMPDIKLLFVGAQHDPSREYVQSLLRMTAEASLQENVTFAQHRDDVYELISGSRILVHTALNEPMGRVIAEALLLRTPVVAFKSGGIPELIDDGVDGILVEPGDLDGLVRAIKMALEPEVHNQLVENGYRKAKEMFSIDRQSKKILSIYNRLLMNCGVSSSH